jgi:hypothetical protein
MRVLVDARVAADDAAGFREDSIIELVGDSRTGEKDGCDYDDAEMSHWSPPYFRLKIENGDFLDAAGTGTAGSLIPGSGPPGT